MGEISEVGTTLLPNIKELNTLLGVLASNNVYSFKWHGMEVLLSPQVAPAVPDKPEITNVPDETGSYGIWSAKDLK